LLVLWVNPGEWISALVNENAHLRLVSFTN
jgi:hypothetical protein